MLVHKKVVVLLRIKMLLVNLFHLLLLLNQNLLNRLLKPHLHLQ